MDAHARMSAIHLGVDRCLLPTLFWWSTSDQFLIASCVTVPHWRSFPRRHRTCSDSAAL
jgi:hypothetical protein